MAKFPFNRPVLYTTLLSEQALGVTTNHAVYASVVADEFTIRTPDALMNGTATELLIQSCCPDLINTRKILLCDIQHLLATIKIATQRPDLEVLLKCPKCGENDPYEISLQRVVPSLTAKKWFDVLPVDNLFVTFRSPTYEEFSTFSIADFKFNKQLHQISQLESSEVNSNLASLMIEQRQKLHVDFQTRCITSISNGEDINTSNHQFIKEWFEQCDITVQKQIADYLDAAKKENSIADFSVTCTECNHPFAVPIDLDASSQFRKKIIPANEEEILDMIKQMGQETKDLTNDILKMIWFMRGSISYAEAFALSIYERQCISKIIESNIELTKESGIALL